MAKMQLRMSAHSQDGANSALPGSNFEFSYMNPSPKTEPGTFFPSTYTEQVAHSTGMDFSIYSTGAAGNANTNYFQQRASTGADTPFSEPQPQHHTHGLPAPILTQPDPSLYRNPRTTLLRDYSGQPTHTTQAPQTSQTPQTSPSNAAFVPSTAAPRMTLRGSFATIDDGRHPSGAPSSFADPLQRAQVPSTTASRPNGGSNNYSPVQQLQSDDNTGADNSAECVTNLPVVTLSDKATEEEQTLFRLHNKYRDYRGKGMWEAIAKEFSKTYPDTANATNTACLQMKFTRAFRRHIQWPSAEKELLLQAYHAYENERYHRILACMKEKGGCKVWEWKPADIELMLVRLGLEEPTLDDTRKTRRRRRAGKHRQSAVGSHNPHQDATAGMMASGPWSTNTFNSPMSHPQYSLQPPHQPLHPNTVPYDAMNGIPVQHQAHQAHQPHPPHQQLPSEVLSQPRLHNACTADQENDLLEQISAKYPEDDEMSNMSGEREDASRLMDNNSNHTNNFSPASSTITGQLNSTPAATFSNPSSASNFSPVSSSMTGGHSSGPNSATLPPLSQQRPLMSPSTPLHSRSSNTRINRSEVLAQDTLDQLTSRQSGFRY